MAERLPIRVLATGAVIREEPEPAAGELGPGALVAWQAGELVFVTVADFVEFDGPDGLMRWEGTPQGPFAVPLGVSATSRLIDAVDALANDQLGDLRIAGYAVSRFAFRAAPRRIDVEPALAARLTLD